MTKYLIALPIVAVLFFGGYILGQRDLCERLTPMLNEANIIGAC